MDVGAQADPEKVRAVQRHLEQRRGARQTNKVLYGHPSPLLWRELTVPVTEVLAEHHAAAPDHRRLNVHVSTPYCLPTQPPRCGFCYLPCEPLAEPRQLDDYLDLLRQEGALYGPHLEASELISVYFGGGTANLYRAGQYRELMGIVRTVFPEVAPEVQLTLEGVPQLFSRDKLEAMRDAGFNRISIGVQQLAPEMIGMSGRKQTREQVFRAIDWCRTLGLACSVDLIYGWPLQTEDGMLADLEAITATGVAHLTHYELNVAGRTDFALNRSHQLPTTEQNLAFYHSAKAFLEERGYLQITAHDWRKPRTGEVGEHRYEESWHLPLRIHDGSLHTIDMWGWGFGGVSFFLGTPQQPGWTYRNHTDVSAYREALAAGRFPVERGFRFTARDQRLNALFQALQGRRVDRSQYLAVFGLDVVDEHAAVWQALTELGWAEISEGFVSLIGDGVFYTPLIQSTLAAAASGRLAFRDPDRT